MALRVAIVTGDAIASALKGLGVTAPRRMKCRSKRCLSMSQREVNRLKSREIKRNQWYIKQW